MCFKYQSTRKQNFYGTSLDGKKSGGGRRRLEKFWFRNIFLSLGFDCRFALVEVKEMKFSQVFAKEISYAELLLLLLFRKGSSF